MGSAPWIQQHIDIEKLNVQAHFSAQERSDEYVVEAVISNGKLLLLVHQIIAIEVGYLAYI